MAKTSKPGKSSGGSSVTTEAARDKSKASASRNDETPPTLKQSLKERGENAGTNRARGRHGANPKQSGSGGSAQYIRRSMP